MKVERGPSPRFSNDFDFEPIHASADSRAQGLGTRFFGGKSRREAFRWPSSAQAIGLFRGREDSIEKARTEALHRIVDPSNLNHIDAATDDHSAYQAKSSTKRAYGSTPRLLVDVAGSRPDGVVRKPGIDVALPHIDQGCIQRSDKFIVLPLGPIVDRPPGSSDPWLLQIGAIALEDPSQLVRILTGGILGCGGWVLSRGTSDKGRINLIFEFERRACIDIYTVLVASGIELSPSGHLRFTELCQCTRMSSDARGDDIASIDLEIQTYPLEGFSCAQGPTAE